MGVVVGFWFVGYLVVPRTTVCGFIQIESSTPLLDMIPKSSKLENAVEKQVILRVLIRFYM